MRELTIGKNDAGQRLDRFLSKALPLLPGALALSSDTMVWILSITTICGLFRSITVRMVSRLVSHNSSR